MCPQSPPEALPRPAAAAGWLRSLWAARSQLPPCDAALPNSMRRHEPVDILQLHRAPARIAAASRVPPALCRRSSPGEPAGPHAHIHRTFSLPGAPGTSSSMPKRKAAGEAAQRGEQPGDGPSTSQQQQEASKVVYLG